MSKFKEGDQVRVICNCNNVDCNELKKSVQIIGKRISKDLSEKGVYLLLNRENTGAYNDNQLTLANSHIIRERLKIV